MPDEKWLWDRPHSWHAVNRSLLDIGVLLNHLNELPDSRLLVRSYPLQERAKRRGPWDFRKRRSELLACNQQKVLDRSRIGLIPVSHVCRIGAEPEFAAGLSAA